MWLLDRFLRKVVRSGRLTITDADGRVYNYGQGEQARIHLRFTDKRTAMHIARYPALGAGEAYMRGWLVVEAPHDIRDLVLMITAQASHASEGIEARSKMRLLFDKLGWWADQFNYRARSSKNVKHHYDLDRQFYELFLDEDRQYTMAYFADGKATLERAQLEKKALIAAKLHMPADASGMRVLDIGCGWGGLGLYLNRHYGCEVLGISLAPDQVQFANERAAAAGVADKVKFQLVDYRDLTERFDRITSVGMIEHVGARHFGEYFKHTFDRLHDDGIMLTHTIGRTDGPGFTDAWTRKYIFPGGYIPAMSELIRPIERTGWQLGDVEILRYHYAETLAEWYRRTTLHGEEITRLYDAELLRMWQFYLAGAEQAFRNDRLVNFHIQSVKRQGVLPMTRDYIQTEAARLGQRETPPQWHLAPRVA
ncbi:MAG: class I SAM-dependent methyltransferase [Sphingomonadales bacterium]|nr:class I SAM-dependent methyltransferase [Sphingomonadales bacterium]MDE2170648.1 class I SAM-dependent methyltransferase [Sphingomonadales bacterium]